MKLLYKKVPSVFFVFSVVNFDGLRVCGFAGLGTREPLNKS